MSAENSSEALGKSTPELAQGDDPSKLESTKRMTLLEGIKKFNFKHFKPKRGISFLIEPGFIASNSPQDIANFLLHTDGLSKVKIGEYLGDEENIATLHAFVDSLNFNDLPFVDAFRVFLQSFRLPGGAHELDRCMLKFAERYIAKNPQTVLANVDAAYVLAYSVLMLNTDAHHPQVTTPMTKAEFIRNNRGINDNADLPEDLLFGIYDDIVNNELGIYSDVVNKEIKLKDAVETELPLSTGVVDAGAT